MKRTILPLLLLAAATLASGETFLRVEGGVERRSELATNGLPAEIAVPLRERMIAQGWLPFEPAVKPADTWCSTWVRTLTATNGVWKEGWAEASVPVPLDRVALVGTVLSMPNGTNLLAAGEPTYSRGSLGARTVAAALGIDAETLEALVAASLGLAPATEE